MQMQTVEQVKKRIDQLLDRDQVTDKELEEVYSQAVDRSEERRVGKECRL